MGLVRGTIVYYTGSTNTDELGKTISRDDKLVFINHDANGMWFHKPKLLERLFPRLCRHVFRNIVLLNEKYSIKITNRTHWLS